MARRELSGLPLAPLHKTRLYNSGYLTTSDLQGVDCDKLSKDTGLSTEESKKILDIVIHKKPSRIIPVTALSLLRQEQSTLPIVTFCERLDTALGGGIQCGRLTEFCGIPGVGKTQLCIQLACDVQIPTLFGGLDGEVIYIDTEGGFIIDRVIDIVTATVQHCQFIADRENREGKWDILSRDKESGGIPADLTFRVKVAIDATDTVSKLTVDKLLSGIHCYSCYDCEQVLATINLLPSFLKDNRKVKLVILDSVAFHFRHNFDDLSLRTRVLTNLAQTLLQMAAQFDLAVVVTNQMTTKVHSGTDKGSHLIPSLGESWGHACTTRLILQREGTDRVAWLYKSPTQRQAKVPFQITKDGIRDAVSHVSSSSEQRTDSELRVNDSEDNPSKRQRTC